VLLEYVIDSHYTFLEEKYTNVVLIYLVNHIKDIFHTPHQPFPVLRREVRGEGALYDGIVLRGFVFS
jgi:hypothetical protein